MNKFLSMTYTYILKKNISYKKNKDINKYMKKWDGKFVGQ